MSGTAPNPSGFLTALKQGAVVLDGAMGTELYDRGVPYSACFEALCRMQPQLVLTIQQAYREAGARVLATHSFGANAYRLRAHGLQDQVADLNTAAAKIARQAAAGAYVLGSMGPTGCTLDRCAMAASIRAAFELQARALWGAGVDGFLLETFRQPQELYLALSAIRGALPVGVPVVACVSFDPSGTVADGSSPEQIALRLAEWGASAIGVNCAGGPAQVYEMITRMGGPGLPRVAKPNAGMPQRVGDKLIYEATPLRFASYARDLYRSGIQAVGGCCGTTAAHIREIAAVASPCGRGHADGGHGGNGEGVGGPRRRGPDVGGNREKGPADAQLGRRFLVSVDRSAGLRSMEVGSV